jgi:hypothetical protein
MKPSIDCAAYRVEVLALIKVAFGAKKVPSPSEIPAGKPDQSQEYAYSQDFFAGRQWQALKHSDLLHRYPSGASAMVTFLSEVGFAYYVPAFMSCILENFRESGTLLESLLTELSALSVAKGSELLSSKVEHLNAAEKQCIAHFLSFLATCHSTELPEETYGDIAPSVLARSWRRFLV